MLPANIFDMAKQKTNTTMDEVTTNTDQQVQADQKPIEEQQLTHKDLIDVTHTGSTEKEFIENVSPASSELVQCRILKREISLTSEPGTIIALEKSRFEVLEAWEFVEKVTKDDK